uniref:Uncharacterized protein n=1 Tax=Arundo donax TaxID=35708 RepID=A0A0A8ZVS8_ARUDO
MPTCYYHCTSFRNSTRVKQIFTCSVCVSGHWQLRFVELPMVGSHLDWSRRIYVSGYGI